MGVTIELNDKFLRLGTFIKDTPFLISDKNGRVLSIDYNIAYENGTWFVGDKTKVAKPANVVSNIIFFVGKKYSDIKNINKPNKIIPSICDDIRFILDGELFTVEEVFSNYLKLILQTIDKDDDAPLKLFIVSSNCNDINYSEAIRDSCRLIGIEKVFICSQAACAALSYGYMNNIKEGKVLSINKKDEDTIEVSCIEIKDGVYDSLFESDFCFAPNIEKQTRILLTTMLSKIDNLHYVIINGKKKDYQSFSIESFFDSISYNIDLTYSSFYAVLGGCIFSAMVEEHLCDITFIRQFGEVSFALDNGIPNILVEKGTPIPTRKSALIQTPNLGDSKLLIRINDSVVYELSNISNDKDHRHKIRLTCDIDATGEMVLIATDEENNNIEIRRIKKISPSKTYPKECSLEKGFVYLD